VLRETEVLLSLADPGLTSSVPNDPLEYLEELWSVDPERCLAVLKESSHHWEDDWHLVDAVQRLMQRHADRVVLECVYRCITQCRQGRRVRLQLLGQLLRNGYQPAVDAFVRAFRGLVEDNLHSHPTSAPDISESIIDINRFSLLTTRDDLRRLREARIERAAWSKRLKGFAAALVESTLMRFDDGPEAIIEWIRAHPGDWFRLPAFVFSLGCACRASDAAFFAELYDRYPRRRCFDVRRTALDALLYVAAPQESALFWESRVRTNLPNDLSSIRRFDPQLGLLISAASFAPSMTSTGLSLLWSLAQVPEQSTAATAWLGLRRHGQKSLPTLGLPKQVLAAEEQAIDCLFLLAPLRSTQ
jgi:hypothetical protein